MSFWGSRIRFNIALAEQPSEAAKIVAYFVIPKGWVCPRNLIFPVLGEEKQIPRFARDDKKHFFHGL